MTDVVVVGLALGDEGKGATVDAVAEVTGARDVVRFGGGPQALHHVVASDGRWHGCSQLGSALLHPGARTWLGPEMLVDPLALGLELEAASALGVTPEQVRLHGDAVVVTPLHGLINKARERARGDARHGSCGRGVGEAWADTHERGVPPVRLREVAALARGALPDGGRSLHERLEALRRRGLAAGATTLGDARLPAITLQHWHERGAALFARPDAPPRPTAPGPARRARLDQPTGAVVLDDAAFVAGLRGAAPLVYEGAQGAGLDREAGLWPHVTATGCGPQGALRLGARLGRPAVVVGVTRATTTRHGAGPLPSHAAALDAHVTEPHNAAGPWQGDFRHGWLDLVWLRSGVALSRPDALALTCLDHLSGLGEVAVCVAWQLDTPLPRGVDAWLTRERGRGPVTALVPPTGGPRDRAQRAALSRALAGARPVLRWLPGWPSSRSADGALHPHARAFAEHVAGELGVPLWSVADGPTRADRVALRALPAPRLASGPGAPLSRRP